MLFASAAKFTGFHDGFHDAAITFFIFCWQVSAEELAALAGLGGGARELAILREMAADSRSIMERCNIRLVVAIARKYHGQRDMDFRDLIHAGLQGLHKAFEKFDTEKGVKFSTYGHWWVRQGISRCLCQESRVVRLPSHVVDNISRIYRAASKLASLRGEACLCSGTSVSLSLGT